MTLPSKPSWANREPNYKGGYDFSPDAESVTIGSSGYTDFEVDAGIINEIYSLIVTTSSTEAWRLVLFDSEDRGDEDMCFQTAEITGNYNSATDGDGLIVQVDKDGSSNIWFRMYGVVGEAYSVSMSLVRQI